ncbi:hypothetical protein Tco_0369616 [Tanacetum coccineum]
MKKNVKKIMPYYHPYLPLVVYQKPNAELTLMASDGRDYSNVPQNHEEEEDKPILRSIAKDLASVLKKHLKRIADKVPRGFSHYVETTIDPINASMSMRFRIKKFPKINDAYRKLMGIRVEDRRDNGLTHLLPMYGVPRDHVSIFASITSNDQSFTVDRNVNDFLITRDFSMILGQPVHTDDNLETTEFNRHKVSIVIGGIFSIEARDIDMKLLSAPESNNTLASGWPLVLAVLGYMAHLVASITLNSTRSGSIIFYSFLPLVLLWLVIVVVVVSVVVTVFVIVVIVGVVVKSSSVVKLSFVVT